ncbi:MAG: BsuPI-related putative proteinase inhibitor [Candidatus Bathyarchaeales archaeon]
MNKGKHRCLLLLSVLISFYFVSFCQGCLQNNENLLLQISTDKNSYTIGEPILISLSLVNPTDEVITLTFRTSEIFDGSVWIYREDGEFFEKIYDAADYVFLQVITVVEIQPYSSREILNLNYSSSLLKPGKYVIKAISEKFSAETSIEVFTRTMPELSVMSIILFLVLFTFFIGKFRPFKSLLPSRCHSSFE